MVRKDIRADAAGVLTGKVTGKQCGRSLGENLRRKTINFSFCRNLSPYSNHSEKSFFKGSGFGDVLFVHHFQFSI